MIASYHSEAKHSTVERHISSGRAHKLWELAKLSPSRSAIVAPRAFLSASGALLANKRFLIQHLRENLGEKKISSWL
jgi:hypothetical protein